MRKTPLVIALVLIAAAAGFFLFRGSKDSSKEESHKAVQAENILSFNECIKAGYPTLGVDPRRCKLPDGRVYVEEMKVVATYKNIDSSSVVLDTPYPGAVTGKEFQIKGKAKGNFFFEAVFPIELQTEEGKTIVSTHAQAEGEWMTTNLVPFTAKISVPATFMGKAVLILKKDNPSGMPENDAEVRVPITVEY